MTKQFLWSTAFLVVLSILLSAQTPPPGAAAGAQGRGGRGGVTLPEGAGKASIEAYCTKCHQLGNIVNSGGFTRDGWQELISTMVSIPADQAATIVDYLAKNFPEQP